MKIRKIEIVIQRYGKYLYGVILLIDIDTVVNFCSIQPIILQARELKNISIKSVGNLNSAEVVYFGPNSPTIPRPSPKATSISDMK